MSSKYVCLLIPFPPSTNNLFVNNPRTRGRFPSDQYKAWQEEARRFLYEQAPVPSIKGPVKVLYSFARPDNRKRDLFNLEKAVSDALVEHGVIEDDSLIVHGTLRWAEDVENGCRVEIEAA